MLHIKKINITFEYLDNPYSVILLYELLQDVKNPNRILIPLNAIDSNLLKTELAIELKQKIINAVKTREELLIGKLYKDEVLMDTFNFKHQLKEYIGKPILLIFTATWCQPCKENIPIYKTIFDKFKSKGLQVLYINLHDNRVDWMKLINHYKLDWDNLSELTIMKESKIAKSYNIESIPDLIFFNKKGEIVYQNIQIEDDDNYNILNKIIKLELIND